MTLPKENLDNKAFSDLLKEAISRIPVYAPEWTDHNIHDPGITFIELFAWLTEMQIYRLNRINDKNYRKFLKLMGIPELKSARAAKVDVTFSLKYGVTYAHVPKGTIIAAKDPMTDENILFTTEKEVKLTNIESVTVTAIHATPYNDTKECNFSSSGLPDFYIDLKYTPVLDNTLIIRTDETWTEVEDFDASKPGDRHYTVDLASGRVTFGNGINGKIPPKGIDNITVSYCSGGGVLGNVKAKSITRILDKSLDERVNVTNKEAASCGTEAETLEEAIQRVRKEMKEVTRAVKSADYEYLSLITPGVRVARAKALPRYHPSQYGEVPGIISVIVVPENSSNNSNPMPSQDFLEAVYWYLEEYRLLATELFVLPPKYVNVSVTATVVVKPKNVPNKVKESVENKLKDFLHPVSGGIEGKGWPFGRSVYISEIYEVIDSVEGVNYVIPDSVKINYIADKNGVIPNFVTIKKNSNGQTIEIDVPSEGLVYLVPEETRITAEEEANVFGV